MFLVELPESNSMPSRMFKPQFLWSDGGWRGSGVSGDRLQVILAKGWGSGSIFRWNKTPMDNRSKLLAFWHWCFHGTLSAVLTLRKISIIIFTIRIGKRGWFKIGSTNYNKNSKIYYLRYWKVLKTLEYLQFK